MSTHKTLIEENVVTNFLNGIFPEGISNFEVIKGGEGSQAYSFSALGTEYIIRVSKHSSNGFKKDEYAFTHYASSNIPIPKIHSIGSINDNLHFCISQKAEGKILDLFNGDEIRIISGDLFNVLDAIHATDISTTKGYGRWNTDGQAHMNSWQENILNVDMHAKGSSEKPSLFETTFLEKDFWDKAYVRLVEMVHYCPEERYLLHADYGFNNVLSDGYKITGVIDWENSMYGDFVFDIAWLCYWGTTVDYKKLYIEHCKNKDRIVENFEERLLCYMLQIGLGSLSFYAYSNQEDKYQMSKKILEKLL